MNTDPPPPKQQQQQQQKKTKRINKKPKKHGVAPREGNVCVCMNGNMQPQLSQDRKQ